MRRFPVLLAALLIAAPALAQTVPGIAGEAMTGSGAVLPATSTITGKTIKVPVQIAMCANGVNYTACPAGNRVETFQLATANVASAPATPYGGDYIFAQTCSGYGTVALQALGPDGATYQTVLSKTATDTAGGTGIAVAGGATMKVVLTGTTGCNATLSRVP